MKLNHLFTPLHTPGSLTSHNSSAQVGMWETDQQATA